MTLLAVVNAVATHENVLRLQFNDVLHADGLLTPADGLNPALYSIAPVAGTFGLDGSPARPVSVVLAMLTDTFIPIESFGQYLDLVVDRSFTSFPASYTVTLSTVLRGVTNGTIDPSLRTFAFSGTFREIEQPREDPTIRRRDIANAQTKSALGGVTPDADNPLLLGTYSYDDQGDYSADDASTALIKRILRRIFVEPLAFAHLPPDYGLGLAAKGKKLLTAGLQQSLQAEAAKQLQKDPDIAKATVSWAQDSVHPELVRISIFVKTRAGKGIKFSAPFRPRAG